MKKITFVYADDWMGLYIDGELVRENHSLEPDDVLLELGIKYDDFWAEVEDGGRLPKKLKDVKRA